MFNFQGVVHAGSLWHLTRTQPSLIFVVVLHNSTKQMQKAFALCCYADYNFPCFHFFSSCGGGALTLWHLTTPDWVYRKHCSGNIQHWTVSVRTAQIILCLVNVCCSTDKHQLWILSYLWPVCIKKRYINYTLHMKRYWTNSFSLTTRGSPLHVIYPGFF